MPDRPAIFGRTRRRADKRVERGTACQRGYDRRWRIAAAVHLSHEPLCRACLALGRTTAATIVDHIVPHRGDQQRFWAATNWQSLCVQCHGRKTAAGQ